MSIYEFTKLKLITHGVHKHEVASLVLSDKRLFLLFVKLERARRLADFGVIHARVDNIASYAKAMGKPYLVIYAYMYIRFSEFTPRIIQVPVKLENGDLRYVRDYRNKVTQHDIAIGEWATSMYLRHEKAYFYAIYSSQNHKRIYNQFDIGPC